MFLLREPYCGDGLGDGDLDAAPPGGLLSGIMEKVSLNRTSLLAVGERKVTRLDLGAPPEEEAGGFFLMVPPSGESQLNPCS